MVYAGYMGLSPMSSANPKSYTTLQRRTLWAAGLGFFILVLDSTIVSIALPSIGQTFGGSIGSLQWIADGYLILLAGLLLMAGSFADAFGSQRVFVYGTAAFMVASALCAGAVSGTMLEVFRAIQGAAAAFVLPASLAIIRQVFDDPGQRTKAIAAWASVGGIAVAVGPVLGGVLTQTFGWRAIFLINVPVCILTMYLAAASVDRAQSARRSLDLPGQVLSFAMVAAISYGLIQGGEAGWQDPSVLTAFTVGALALVSFLMRELHVSEPAVPLRLFKRPLFSSVNFTGLSLNFTTYGLIFMLSLLFQQVWQHSALIAGLMFLPMTATVALANLSAGQLARRFSHRLPFLLGQIILLAGLFSCLAMDAQTPAILALLMLLPLGVGAGMSVPPLNSFIIESVPATSAGIASGILNLSRQFGSILGIALFGALAATSNIVRGLHQSVIVCCMAITCSLAVSFLYAKE